MTPADLKSTGQLLDLLIAKGVRSFKGHGVELELFPPNQPEHASAKTDDIDRCRCGHEVVAHTGEGLCIHGCDVDKCAGPEEKSE